jgi:hypothetical protein
MGTADWVQIVVAVATIYFMWQQNRIFQRQNQIIAAQSKRTTMIVDTSWQVRVRRYWPTYVMIVLIAVTAYDIYDRHHGFGYDPARAWDDNKPLERVYKHDFTNETVVLDGKYFIPPTTFDNVTFVYNGTGPFDIHDFTFKLHDGKMMSKAASRNKVVTQTMELMGAMAYASGCKAGWINLGPHAEMEGTTPATK